MYFRVANKPKPTTPTLEVHRAIACLRHERMHRHVVGKDRVNQVIESSGTTASYSYDTNGDLTIITEANGQQTHYHYDRQQRLVKVHYADGSKRLFVYDDALNNLTRITGAGVDIVFEYDADGRLVCERHGSSNVIVYRYDEQGRAAMARTPRVAMHYAYNERGQLIEIQQHVDGIGLNVVLCYDEHGRLQTLSLPKCDTPLTYTWSEGKLLAVNKGDTSLVRYQYEADRMQAHYGNGVVETITREAATGLVTHQSIQRPETVLFERNMSYDEIGRCVDDGRYQYQYDTAGQLIQAHSATDTITYTYDKYGNRTAKSVNGRQTHYYYDGHDRLQDIYITQQRTSLGYDAAGRIIHYGAISYRYDDRGQLIEVRRNSAIIARMTYDYQGLLVLIDYGTRQQRFIYGPAQELLAVTDSSGQPLRYFVPTPMGILAELDKKGSILYHHNDTSGTTHLLTNFNGQVVAQPKFSPFGIPLSLDDEPVLFAGHHWIPELQLYYCGSRWYDPCLGRFITPDTFTGAPDDARLMNPHLSPQCQGYERRQLLPDWLRQPRLRNRYTYCLNDPVGRVDPDGHWSFGGVLLMVFGTIWASPMTLLGIALEATCFIGEVLRWLVYLFSGGNLTWQTLGFNAAASGRLNAYAIIFEGGWLGSLPLLGITFGNIVFLSGDWEEQMSGSVDVFPAAYEGEVALSLGDALLEHELRHTNQYSWFGPLYLLVYLIDWLASGVDYERMWLERDARERAGL